MSVLSTSDQQSEFDAFCAIYAQDPDGVGTSACHTLASVLVPELLARPGHREAKNQRRNDRAYAAVLADRSRPLAVAIEYLFRLGLAAPDDASDTVFEDGSAAFDQHQIAAAYAFARLAADLNLCAEARAQAASWYKAQVPVGQQGWETALAASSLRPLFRTMHMLRQDCQCVSCARLRPRLRFNDLPNLSRALQGSPRSLWYCREELERAISGAFSLPSAQGIKYPNELRRLITDYFASLERIKLYGDVGIRHYLRQNYARVRRVEKKLEKLDGEHREACKEAVNYMWGLAGLQRPDAGNIPEFAIDLFSKIGKGLMPEMSVGRLLYGPTLNCWLNPECGWCR